MLFYDLHSDLATATISNKEKEYQIKLSKENKNCVISAIYKGDNSLKKSVFIAKNLKKMNANIAFEDCCYSSYFCEDKKVNEDKLVSLVNILCSFNPQYISLGWNYNNLFLGGCAENGDLTEHGELVVELLNERNICIDSAHANKKSFYSLLLKTKRLICSHTAFEWVFPHRRNIDKDQVRCILQKGGIIGIVGVGHFLTGVKGIKKNYEQAFYEHLQSYLQEFGSEGLCIATDFYGSDATVYPNGDYSFVYELKNRLIKSGVSEFDIDRVFYKNAYNYFKSLKKV